MPKNKIDITAKTHASDILYELYLNGTVAHEDLIEVFFPYIEDDLEKHDLYSGDLDYGDLELVMDGDQAVLKITDIPVEEEDE